MPSCERGPSHFSSLIYFPHTYSSHLYLEVNNIIPHTYSASDEADTFLFSCIQFQDHIISAAYESSPSSLLPFPPKSSFTLYWALNHNISSGGFYNPFKQTSPLKLVIEDMLHPNFFVHHFLVIKVLPPSLLLGHFDNLFSCEGEERGAHGALRPAQVVLRLDQQVHQRQTLRLRARTRTAFVSNFYLQAKIGYK